MTVSPPVSPVEGPMDETPRPSPPRTQLSTGECTTRSVRLSLMSNLNPLQRWARALFRENTRPLGPPPRLNSRRRVPGEPFSLLTSPLQVVRGRLDQIYRWILFEGEVRILLASRPAPSRLYHYSIIPFLAINGSLVPTRSPMLVLNQTRWLALALVLVEATAFASQHPLATSKALNKAPTAPLTFLPNAYHVYDEGLFTPFEDLSALSESDFTHMSHPIFPRYAVRIKKTKFCDGTVK